MNLPTKFLMLAFGLALVLLLAACNGTQIPIPDSVSFVRQAEVIECLDGTVLIGASVLDANGEVIENAAVEWSSSDQQIATVDESGEVTGLRSGVVEILAEAGVASASVTVDVAPVIEFACANALDDWTLTGDWGIYNGAPESCDYVAVDFPEPALGTDGNRVAGSADPCNDSESEDSSAITPVGVLPSTLTFLSWNVDEASDGYDFFTIVFTPEGGGTAETLLDCESLEWENEAACEFEVPDRPGDAWDSVSIDTGALGGQSGVLEFHYDTDDSCCDSEQGRFLRQVNFRIQGP